MAGLIREEDIAQVRERADLAEIVGQYVTLKPAGGGALKGLCPFHDEKSPSFHVRPGKGFHCLAGETRVITWDGVRPIRELAGGEHRVLGVDARWHWAPFHSYGTQKLWKLTLTRNRQVKEIHATDGHRWFVRSGNDGASRREVITTALKPGDELSSVFPGAGPAAGGRLTAVSSTSSVGWDFASPGGTALLTRPPGTEGSCWVVRSVEETSRVEEVFCAEVEKGHAFVLEDNILTGNCFGCGEGGDVISFLMKHDGLAFNQAVEYLADKTGVQLRYTEGDNQPRRDRVPRARLIEAHRRAQEWYAGHLTGPEGATARTFLTERGFDRESAEKFGLGFAPRDGDALYKHLRQAGFTDEELVTGGLVASGQRGHYDRFRGRLLWPIRETSGETIGFGARRIFDDDRIDAKYLNTPETPIYKKSQVLYGIDLARREIARSSQAVVVEGYTDVMACHLAGVGTAVATCGTAFGEDHGRVLRRLLHDHEEFRGEIIFTFDGDEAGQKAALRAFGGDQQFVAQTYVAVDPDGLDPCDLRIRSGDPAVRELVARRIPLYRFVLSNVVSRYDLDRADGRVDAMREAAKLVSSVRDRSKVEAFARELAGMVGIEIDDARAEVRRATRGQQQRPRTTVQDPRAAPGGEQPAQPQVPMPDPRDPRFSLERETLKVVVQQPVLAGPVATDLGDNDFTHPAYLSIWQAATALGGPAAAPAPEVWVDKLRGLVAERSGPVVQQVLNALAVEPPPTATYDEAYAAACAYRLQEVTALRRIADIKSKLQRTNPVEESTEYNRMFGELVALEGHRRTLRELAIGGAG